MRTPTIRAAIVLAGIIALGALLSSAAAKGPAGLPAGATPLLFAHNGKEVALSYADPADPATQYVLRGGKSLGPYQSVATLAWTADGSTLVHVALAGGTWEVYANGKKAARSFEEYWDRGRESFAPKGSGYFFQGLSGGKDLLLLNSTIAVELFDMSGGPLEPGMGLRDPSWSPDGKDFYCLYALWGESAIYKNGKVLAKAKGASWDAVLSPDGKKLAYEYADEAGRGWISAGDLKYGPYSGAFSPAWSPDGKRVAFCADSRWDAKKGKTWRIMADGEEVYVLPAQGILHPRWLGDSSGLFCEYSEGGKAFMMTPAGAEGPYDQVAFYEYAAEPGGKRLAYASQTGTVWTVHKGDETFVLPEGLGRVFGLTWMAGGKLSWFTAGKEWYDTGRDATTYCIDGAAVYSATTMYGPTATADGKYLGYGSYAGGATRSMVRTPDGEFPGAVFGGKAAYLKDGAIVFVK